MANEALLATAFRRIHATRMPGIPILNAALDVEAFGFRDWNGMRVGVLITPWSINLVILRELDAALPALRLSERRSWCFPSGSYEFMGGDEPECGPFDFCSLFSPALEFHDQAAARRLAKYEGELHAATADIGVAQANFYPSLNLTGSFGLQSLQFGQLFNLNAKQYALGPGLTIPIFQGGQLRSTLQLRNAQQQEAAVSFQKTVLQAWHDVDNALTAYRTEQTRRDELVRAVAENRRALGLAQSRYAQGVADFLSVLDAERSVLGTEQQLAESTTTVSSNLVALYKALGGGWETDMPETRKTAAK